MIIRYLGYTLVRAGRHVILISDDRTTLIEAPTWRAAIQWIENRDKAA
jgi:hypothetical protein